jgi:hypothetical protein
VYDAHDQGNGDPHGALNHAGSPPFTDAPSEDSRLTCYPEPRILHKNVTINCSDTRRMNHRRTILATAVAAVLSGAMAQPQSDTNQIMGQLGYPVGTELTVDGTFGGGKNSWILVTRVNGTNLISKVQIASNLVHPGRNLQTQTNITCRLRGREKTGVVPYQEGQQAAPGRHFVFIVNEVLLPDGLEFIEKKRPNHTSDGIRQPVNGLPQPSR